VELVHPFAERDQTAICIQIPRFVLSHQFIEEKTNFELIKLIQCFPVLVFPGPEMGIK
jgi:hypothetical protein